MQRRRSLTGKMSGRRYNRMSINVAALIAEVHARPVLWDRSSSGYSDRNRRDSSWSEVCVALYPDWCGYEESLRWVIEQDLRKRWKTVRDRFLKWHRQLPAGDSSPSRKVPHHDELLFILPHRRPRPTSGNYEIIKVEPPDEMDEPQQLWEPMPSPSAAETSEAVGAPEIRQDLQGCAQDDQLETHSPQHPHDRPLLIPRSPPLCRVLPSPTRTSSARQRTRRTRDRLLEVERDRLSLIRREQGYDEWDWFGLGFAATCRRLRPEVRNDYVAFCLAAVKFFKSDNQPPLGDLLTHMSKFMQAGPQGAPPRPPEGPAMVTTSTQTPPIGEWAHCL